MTSRNCSTSSEKNSALVNNSQKNNPEAKARELLRLSGCPPGTAPERIAELLGFRVIHRRLPPSILGFSSLQERCIVVSPCDYPPQEAMTVAHELCELFTPDCSPTHERFCQQVAAALILPEKEFLESIWQCNGDLTSLFKKWPNSSWETRAIRIAELVPQIGCESWLNGTPRWRPNSATEAERAAVAGIQPGQRKMAIRENIIASAWGVPRYDAEGWAVTLRISLVGN